LNRLDSILNAEVLKRVEYEKISDLLEFDENPIDPSEWFAFYRTKLELFYRQDLDHDFIINDKKGVLRSKVVMFEKITRCDDIKFKALLKETGNTDDIKNSNVSRKIIKDSATRLSLLYGLLSTTPIFKNGKFIPDAELCSDDLSKFAQISLKAKKTIETQLELNIQKDVVDKPVQHLSKVLSMVGINLRKSRQKNVNKQRVYFYEIDQSSLLMMSEYAKKRAVEYQWDYLNSRYNFTYDALEQEWLDSREHESW
jgi:hypothetical protein